MPLHHEIVSISVYQRLKILFRRISVLAITLIKIFMPFYQKFLKARKYRKNLDELLNQLVLGSVFVLSTVAIVLKDSPKP